MPTQTFPCPFCAKKMGVGIELLGRKVRCPHCNQILVAPSAAPLPQQPTPPDIPKFNLPSNEARESIFGDQTEEGDDVFGEQEPEKPRFPMLPPEPVPVIQPESVPVIQPESLLQTEPTVEMKSPFSEVTPTLPPPPRPVPVVLPAVAPASPHAPTPAPTPAPSSVNNPWAGMDQVPPPSPPAAIPTFAPAPAEPSPFATVEQPRKNRRDSDESEPPRRGRTAPAPAGNPLFKVGFFILAPYALLVTLAAIYGLFFKSSVPSSHPLSNLPDNFGEFGPAERKKTGKLPANIDGDLPADQKVALGSGNKLEIGQLEIEPLAVQQRNLEFVSEGKLAGDRFPEKTTAPAIVLKLRIRNTSEDLVIHPLDPAFNRRIVGPERIGTGLVVGKTTYWGGAINWPFSERVVRKYEAAQEADATPLKPGESREYVVFTDANQRVVKAVRDASESLLWRIHVRRGRIDFEGKDIPITAIIGVEFNPSDIKDPD